MHGTRDDMTPSDDHPILERVRTHIRHSLQQMNNAATPTELREITLQVFHDVMEQLQVVERHYETAIHAAEQFMMTHLHEGVTLQTLAERLGYSQKYCSEWFRAKTGKTFSAYHTQLRLLRAEALLAHRDIPLSAIAEALGFQDQFAFSRFFRKTTGSSPSKHRTRIIASQDVAGK